jgi:hypothetical protein
MTMPGLRSGKLLDSLGGFSTASDGDRQNVKSFAQIAKESASLDASDLLLLSRIAAGQRTKSSRLRSSASSAAIKSP